MDLTTKLSVVQYKWQVFLWSLYEFMWIPVLPFVWIASLFYPPLFYYMPRYVILITLRVYDVLPVLFWGAVALWMLKHLAFAVASLRPRVYYRLVPPVKARYDVALWESLWESLVREPAPTLGPLSLLRIPPDISFAFTKEGVIVSVPRSYEKRLVEALIHHSYGNVLYRFEKISRPPRLRGYVSTFAIRRRLAKKVVVRKEGGREEEEGLPYALAREATQPADPTGDIVEKFALRYTQKDPPGMAYRTAITGGGWLVFTVYPLWSYSLFTFVDRLRHPSWAKAVVRVRVVGEVQSALHEQEIGLVWTASAWQPFFWWLWLVRATAGIFGTMFEPFSVMAVPEIAFYARLPIRLDQYSIPTDYVDMLAMGSVPEELQGPILPKHGQVEAKKRGSAVQAGGGRG